MFSRVIFRVVPELVQVHRDKHAQTQAAEQDVRLISHGARFHCLICPTPCVTVTDDFMKPRPVCGVTCSTCTSEKAIMAEIIFRRCGHARIHHKCGLSHAFLCHRRFLRTITWNLAPANFVVVLCGSVMTLTLCLCVLLHHHTTLTNNTNCENRCCPMLMLVYKKQQHTH